MEGKRGRIEMKKDHGTDSERLPVSLPPPSKKKKICRRAVKKRTEIGIESLTSLKKNIYIYTGDYKFG